MNNNNDNNNNSSSNNNNNNNNINNNAVNNNRSKYILVVLKTKIVNEIKPTLLFHGQLLILLNIFKVVFLHFQHVMFRLPRFIFPKLFEFVSDNSAGNPLHVICLYILKSV